MAPSPADRDFAQDRRRLEGLVSALQAGRHGEAVEAAEAALADGLIHPLPLRLAATMRQQHGRFEEAVALFQHAVDLSPRDPHGWAALAACLFAARRPEAALESSGQALSLAPTEPALLCGRAQILQSLGHLDEAADLYRRALETDPALFPARFGQAQIAVEAGRWDEGAVIARDIRARFGDLPALGWLEARIAMGQGDFEGARERIAQILADEHLSPDQRAETLLLRGEALDALNRPTEAFQAAVEGKAIQRQLYAERAVGGEGEIARLTRLAGWFRAADPEPWRQAPAPGSGEARTHVFLVGFPQSGASRLARILAGHPDVVTLETAPTLAAPYAEFMTSDEGLDRLASLNATEAAVWRARYWAEVRAQGAEPKGRVFVDEAFAGTLCLPLVAKLFPKAKVLLALRDPRDMVLACLRTNVQLTPMTYPFTSLTDTAACYDASMTLAGIYRRVLPLDLLDVRQEDLAEDFDATLAHVAAFLDLPVVPGMRAAQQGASRWRAYARQLGPVAHLLAPWVERFGYPTD
ncbi:MAG: sulfotransferase [Caulobacteraceae bacterium]|nr:sulfotransferase [Caulobacteraceae bacterium]